jgi:FG-GAP repeat
MRPHPPLVAVTVVATLTAATTAAPGTGRGRVAALGAASPGSDFNGDGFSDLALGVPREDVGDVRDVGAVTVLYGSPTGVTAAGDQLWHQDAAGIPEAGETSDLWAYALADGDVNGDGFDDLAVGAPFEDVGSRENAGAVTLLFGSPHGLMSSGSEVWTQASPDVPDSPERGDQFGFALGFGHVDADRYADLIVAVQREDVRGVANAGSVQVFSGSRAGLMPAKDGRWSQGRSLSDDPEKGDEFGAILACGDVTGDGIDDLAVGIPSEDLRGESNAGVVQVLHGTSSGLTGAGDQLFNQGSRGMGDAAEAGDGFGGRLAIGDIDGDGRADLVAGAFLENVAAHGDAGAFNVLEGAPGGVVPAGHAFWNQDSRGVPGAAGTADDFAKALALGDLNDDGRADLAVGARYDDEAGPPASGAVDVLYGSRRGLSASGAQLWTQNSPGVPDVAEERDHFGSILSISHLAHGPDELAVGVHFEGLGPIPLAGALAVLPGSSSGATGDGARIWTQDTRGVLERADSNDFLPFSLAGGG